MSDSPLRLLDLLLLGAAPVAAFVTTVKLSRSANALRWLAAAG